jgi:hypothetical protein
MDGMPVQNAVCRVVARLNGEVVGSVDALPDKEISGVYSGSLKGLPDGQMMLRAEGSTVETLLASENRSNQVETEVIVEPEDVLELRNTQCNLSLLSRIADLTGGALIPPTGLGAAMSAIDLSPKISKTVETQPLWDRWIYLWIILTCLTIEWILRKRTGLA